MLGVLQRGLVAGVGGMGTLKAGGSCGSEDATEYPVPKFRDFGKP